VFGLDRFIQDFCVFSVQFRQVYTGFLFIQCSVETGLYRISVYSVFGVDRFHCIIFFYQIPMPDIPEPEFMEKYPQIKKFCYVSSTKGTVSSNIYLISKKGYGYQ